MTRVAERPFSALLEGWSEDPDGNPEIIQSDAGAPHSPPNVIRFTYFQGASGGGERGNRTVVTFSPQNVLYIYMTWKISTNWQGHNATVNKQFYLGNAFPIGSGFNTYFNARGADTAPLQLFIFEQGSPTGDNPSHDSNVGDGTLNRGQWYELEFLFTANTPGVRDGRIEIWKNGVKVMDQSDFGVIDLGEGPGFKTFNWRPIWGGLGDIVESDMHIWLDHVYISGRQ
jgi:hypothetical protein